MRSCGAGRGVARPGGGGRAWAWVSALASALASVRVVAVASDGRSEGAVAAVMVAARVCGCGAVVVRAWGRGGAVPGGGRAPVGVWPRCRGSASRVAWGSRSVRRPVATFRQRRNCRRRPGGWTGQERRPWARRQAARRPPSAEGMRRRPTARNHRDVIRPVFSWAHSILPAFSPAFSLAFSPAFPPGHRGCAIREIHVFDARRELAPRTHRSAFAMARFPQIGEASPLRGRRAGRVYGACESRGGGGGCRRGGRGPYAAGPPTGCRRPSTHRRIPHPPPTGRLKSARRGAAEFPFGQVKLMIMGGGR